MRKLTLAVVTAAALVGASSVGAATFTFDTATSPFTPGVDNQGWWPNAFSSLPASDTNDEYVAHVAFFGLELRNFFTFDLSGFSLGSGETILSASLRLSRFNVHADLPTIPVTLDFWDVSTPAADLNDNSGFNATIFNDLGTGTHYGSVTVLPGSYGADPGDPIPLEAAALADIAASAGGFFSVGGAIRASFQGASQSIYANSGSEGTQQLVIVTSSTLTPIPEPVSLGLFGVGLAGLAALRRGRPV